MRRNTAIAELKVGFQGMSHYGDVVQMSATGMSVRLHEDPQATGKAIQGKLVEMLVIANGSVVRGAATVAAVNGDVVTLAFCGPLRSVQRREHRRIPVDLEATYRSIQDNGCYGIWKRCIVKDISSGGIRIGIGASNEVPHRLEVLFKMRDLAIESLQAALSSTKKRERNKTAARPPELDRPVKVTARVASRRVTDDGGLDLGLVFVAIPPSAQVSLERFFNAAWLSDDCSR